MDGHLDRPQMSWFDGYSVFYVDGDGLVAKLTVQKVMPDDSKMTAPKRIAQKIAGIQGSAANASAARGP